MFGRELLVTFSQSVGLGGLQKAADPLGVFFDVHVRISIVDLAFSKHEDTICDRLPIRQAVSRCIWEAGDHAERGRGSAK
ncbi:hypothetical protein GCM10007908_37680 [Rhizobium albus]|nr:hypothetical protein GCM10007908_37680 [Rhizobium albus]